MTTLLTELDTQIKKTSESTYLAITYDSTNEYCWIIVNNNFPDLGSLSGLPWVSNEYYQNIMSLEDFFNDYIENKLEIPNEEDFFKSLSLDYIHFWSNQYWWYEKTIPKHIKSFLILYVNKFIAHTYKSTDFNRLKKN